MNDQPLVLKVYEGGKKSEAIEPKLSMGDPTSHDWLRDLGYGARFLSRGVSSSRVDFDQFGIAFIIDEAILLAEMQPMGNYFFRWVDSYRFSGLNKLVAVLPEKPDTEAGSYNEHNLSGSADSKDNDGHEGSS